MEFTLQYRGPLKASGSPADKHNLRRHFHRQLKELWVQPPLVHQSHMTSESPGKGKTSLVVPASPFRFVPLVASKLHAVAQLSITLLRPEPPGAIVTRGGDIDNRLKTLLDFLKVSEADALPKGVTPSEDEDPFHCLLEHDKLVTGLSVTTARLLDPGPGHLEVLLLIHVTTEHVVATWDNIGL